MILPYNSLVIFVLLFLLDLEHGHTKPMKNSFPQNFSDEPVGLGEMVFSVVGIADAPLHEVHLAHQLY